MMNRVHAWGFDDNLLYVSDRFVQGLEKTLCRHKGNRPGTFIYSTMSALSY